MYIQGEGLVAITKVFMSGNSQAIRVPAQFRIDADQVEIRAVGDELVIRPVGRGASILVDVLEQMPADFLADGREDDPPQVRDF
jgi:antitoxin VapB